MAEVKKDIDDYLYFIFQKTLLLWLFPYIFWYFGREVYTFVYNWVTEPVSEQEHFPTT